MNRLRTRFGLALVTVLIIATILPVLVLYLLSASRLVEATYVSESQTILPEIQQDDEPLLSRILTPEPNARLPIPFPESPETGQPIPALAFNPETGLWVSRVPSDLQHVVFTSPVFKFRIDLPAWLVLGSLPLISLLIGISLSVWMSRSVTQPVSQLAEATRAIGQRNLDYRVETQGSQELQELAQSFNRMAEELERAEITRRNLMADVAHELRTPLAVLDGNLRAMLDGVHELNEEEIALLYEQTHHLNRLVDDLRELSLAESDQLSLDCHEVDLAHQVREAVGHFHLLAQEQGIQLDMELDEPLVHPCLDENRVRQVLHNLLSNAFRYTPRGGSVAVSVKRLSENDALEIKVTDTGAGISPENLPHIFNRFHRVEGLTGRDSRGTGLGLAIVKAIVEALGGTIRTQSAGKDQGSTFTIRFPTETTCCKKLASEKGELGNATVPFHNMGG